MDDLVQKLTEIKTNKDTYLLPGNIKSGVIVLGVTGTLEELKGETKTITPTTSQQVITPSSGKNGITEITVNAVTSSIDNNIISGNIKKDVQILGVTGTLEEGVDTSDADAVANEIAINKTAYVNGQKVTGTLIEVQNPANINPQVGNNGYFFKPDDGDIYYSSRDRSGCYTVEDRAGSHVGTEYLVNWVALIHNPDKRYYIVNQKVKVGMPFDKVASTIHLTADKIKEGNTILGIQGTVVELQGETKTVKSTTTSQTITPTSGKNGITEITVEPISLQNKTVTPTSSQQTITADNGYDGLGTVTVEASGSNYPPDWSEINYNNTPAYITDGFNYAKNIYDNWNSSITDIRNLYNGNVNLVFFPNVDTSNVVNANGAFYGCTNLMTINLDLRNISNGNSLFYNCKALYDVIINVKNCTNLDSMFNGCNNLKYLDITCDNPTYLPNMFINCNSLAELPQIETHDVFNINNMCLYCHSLTSLPAFDFSNVTDAMSAFYGCDNLTNVPVFNFTKNVNLSSIFGRCSNLSNDSLNNILAMCINATAYTGTKTLAQLGLTSTQANTCQTLSNWNDFVTAGWSSGY